MELQCMSDFVTTAEPWVSENLATMHKNCLLSLFYNKNMQVIFRISHFCYIWCTGFVLSETWKIFILKRYLIFYIYLQLTCLYCRYGGWSQGDLEQLPELYIRIDNCRKKVNKPDCWYHGIHDTTIWHFWWGRALFDKSVS